MDGIGPGPTDTTDTARTRSTKASSPDVLTDAIRPSTVRYIKLGAGDAWFDRCRTENRIEFGRKGTPHEQAAVGDWDAVVRVYHDRFGMALRTARDSARQLRDFYTQPADTLWITFAEGYLWWAIAAPEVHWLGGDGEGAGELYRATRGPWRNTTVSGSPLRADDLSTRLTQVAAYRQTICEVEDPDYVVRRINGLEEPLVAEARAARAQAVAVCRKMIEGLHWRDFEILVDLIFASSGWRRISAVGGSQKDVDLVLEQAATGERASVQVKSRATTKTFEHYLNRLPDENHNHRIFFVCHSPNAALRHHAETDDRVWTGDRLAAMAFKAGVFDWLIDHSR